MYQRLALQINEGRLARRMHHLENERSAIRGGQMKIVVVFARKRPHGSLHPINFPGQACSFRFRYMMRDACFQQHASKFICNSATASTSPRQIERAKPVPPRIAQNPPFQSRPSSTDTGPFTVDKCTTAGDEPYSIRRCSSSHVLRALPQMLAWQLIGA